jgi:hypothetical protein
MIRIVRPEDLAELEPVLATGVDHSNGEDFGTVSVTVYKDGLMKVLEVASLPISSHKPSRRALENRIAAIARVARMVLYPEEDEA